ncbi:hypothetical protein GCM10010116_45250 [Microbispora rosea subsp. aerata]|nr:acyl carrier protein [Microbispora rosea]GGO22431.1 hypothetical protein GCM10010116_45250 [Microbispora rosea subsp. aerata]GIH57444.1 hypothetical protein Mro02_43580 [Microbispora rosea subsp. aerata]GLJ86395.1 hypothetical protein GCM10017588_51320 [Microbispora rosea subsp. aerata]
MTDVKAKITEFLAGHFKNHDLADDEDIFASGYVNSLFVMQLVLMIEREFAITVEDEDLDFANFRSVNALVDFVSRKRAVPVAS